MNKGLSAGILKLIAITAMVIDHVAWVFFPVRGVFSPVAWELPLVMHVIGRITFPVMAFFVAEGYCRTRDLGRYILRLLLFALLSALPFYLVFGTYFNVMFTLLAGLLAVHIREKIREPFAAHLLIFLLALLTNIPNFSFDWGFVGVYVVLLFHRLRDKKWGNAAAVGFGLLLIAATRLPDLISRGPTPYMIMDLMHFGMLLSLPLLYLYKGERGMKLKYFFYAFYPAHLLVLFAAQQWLR